MIYDIKLKLVLVVSCIRIHWGDQKKRNTDASEGEWVMDKKRHTFEQSTIFFAARKKWTLKSVRKIEKTIKQRKNDKK